VKVVDQGAYVVMGPVFSDSMLVSMTETRRAEIPNFTGGEAAAITKQRNPYIFRTSVTQATAMQKVARYLKESLNAKPVVCAGALVTPGDVIMTYDDGVVVVPRARVDEVARNSETREQKEAGGRGRLSRGELGVDIYDMRKHLEEARLRYMNPRAGNDPATNNEETI
jgi:hypothetical protein